MTITPSLKYGSLLTESLLQNESRRSNLWFGLSFNYAF
jgi:hypothetical protein